MNARRHGSAMVASALIATLMLSSPALTVGPGPGGGGGGGGQPGDTTGSLYADLVIALRAENGTPILKKYVVPETETTKAATEYCVQPVSYEPVPGLGATTNPVDGRQVWVIPLQGEAIPDPQTDPPTVPDGFTGACDPEPQYAMFVSEVGLERLNLVRTSDQVIADKLGDVEMKLRFAEAIALQSTGRITFDGTTIDASPENAAIYQSLMTTGTIPGLPTGMAGPPAWIGPVGDAESNSRFDAWELAAVAIGAAASKSTPLNVDTVQYYNRISGLTASTSLWEAVHLVQSADSLADSEKFVDYGGFTYNRSQTYKGSVTWLDVPTLTWKVSRILDVVPFTNLSSFGEIGDRTLTGVVAFAQLADDVRAMSNFIPDNTFIPGFTMDVPGVDTTTAQEKAITDPAVDLGTLPANVFKTYPFDVTASLQNPFGGSQIDGALLRLTVDAPEALSRDDVTATAKGGPSDGQAVPFTVDSKGDLVGSWGPPDTGFPVAPGYNVSTTFVATVAGTAPMGAYNLKLELVRVSDPGKVLAEDTGTITVNDNVTTVLWGDPIPKFTTQGTWATIPLRVYSPDDTTGQLTLTVTGPAGAPLANGAVTVYGETVADMVPMQLDPIAGKLVGTWDVTLGAGFTPVTWYASVAVAAAPGDYTFGVSLAGGNTLTPAVITVFAPESHGEQPPDVGDDTTAPVVTITAVGTPGSTATFTLTAVDENTVTFVCQLTKDTVVTEAWATCESPKTYTGLGDGAYVFSAQATDLAGNVSAVVAYSWVVDTIPPVVTIEAVGTPDSTASFTLTAVDANTVTFECQLTKDTSVTEDWAACESPKTYTNLLPGDYVFSARGMDKALNVSAVVTYPWTVEPPPDTTPPVVTIAPVGTPGATAEFAFTVVDDNPGTIECQLTRDGEVLQAWATCESPKTYNGLEPGTYVFSVRATDLANNTSEPVSSDPWTVVAPPDTTPPVVTITPTLPLGSSATFTLTADEDPVTFECQLTRNGEVLQAWATCESPKTYTSLKPGTYVFSVRATDLAGNISTVATQTWTVRKGGGA